LTEEDSLGIIVYQIYFDIELDRGDHKYVLGLSTAQIPRKASSGRGRALRYIPRLPRG